MADTNGSTRTADFSIMHIIGRFIASAVVLAVTAFVTPGFRINGLWAVVLAAIVLSVLDYIVSRTLHVDATPFGRGLTGFVAAVVIIYAINFILPGYYHVTFFGAILGALVYGIVDMLIPGKAM
jgi:putative membrane protein